MPRELVLRHPQTKAPELSLTNREIKIYHPGYDDEDALMISFPGYDSEEGDLYYDFAHTACAIVSNNHFDGWLSTSRNPQVPRFSEELLAPGKYWWHLPGGNTNSLRCVIHCLLHLDSAQPYAIVPDFRTWQFPRSVPEGWTSRTLERNQTANACQVSQESHASNAAHIVPSSETEWFDKAGLGLSYGSNAIQLGGTLLNANIDNENNILQIRSDLHHAWDQRQFTFVPKRTEEGLGVVIHCWDKRMVGKYHNVPLQGFVVKELLLARLAWTLLPRALAQFLAKTKGTRMLWVRDDHGKLIPQEQTAEQCRNTAYAPVPRSTSPKKRKQNDDGQHSVIARKIIDTGRACWTCDSGLGLGDGDEDDDDEDDEDEDDEDEDDDDDDGGGGGSTVFDVKELTRGRKRFRAGS